MTEPWIIDLVNALRRYEDEHSSESVRAACWLDLVPEDVQREAQAVADYQRARTR